MPIEPHTNPMRITDFYDPEPTHDFEIKESSSDQKSVIRNFFDNLFKEEKFDLREYEENKRFMESYTGMRLGNKYR